MMSEKFQALIVDKQDDKQTVEIKSLSTNDLMEGDVTVRVDYSTINYKDGLAITGKSPIIRKFPLIPGIDFAGTVEQSSHDDFNTGDKVVLNGWGVGEKHHGGFAQMARVPGDWLVRLPDTFNTQQAMAIGTAGYTAMLCVMRLQEHGINAEDGKIIVTGAAGGVGSIAIALLAKLGYKVVASTGRMHELDYLKSLGASRVIDRKEFSEQGRPLDKEKWAGAVDTVGSHTLANVLAQIKYGGAVAACGLAQGMDLPASVAPFILRGIDLLGVDSTMAPKARREQAWQRLAQDLDINLLENMTTTITLSDISTCAEKILAGEIRGRTIVDVRG